MRAVERLAGVLFLASIAAAAASCDTAAVVFAGVFLAGSGLAIAARVGMGCYASTWFMSRHRIRTAITVSVVSLITGAGSGLLMLLVTGSVAYLRCPDKPGFMFPGAE